MNIDDLVRSDLKNMEAYHPVASGLEVKLDANESPWNLPGTIKRKLTHWLETEENLNRYPDSDNTALREAAACFWGVEPDNVTCGVGSDQLIDMLCRVFLEPGDKVITQKPTIGMYAVSANLNHGSAVSVPVGYDLASARKLVAAADSHKAKIIFLCRPNNPTGRGMSEEGVRFVLENANCVVAIDEAYGEFTGASVIDSAKRFPNLVVLKTFSKAFGLAGARVGIAIADSRLIELLDAVKPPFNLPTISQMLAVWTLDESGEFMARAKRLSVSRDRLSDAFDKLDWLEAERSESNFLYIRSKLDIASILEEGGVSVRRFPKSGGDHCVRISLGSDEDNEKVGDLLCAASPK